MDSRLQDIVARSEQLERRLSQMTKTQAMNQATIIALRTELSAAAAAAAAAAATAANKEPILQIDTAGVHRAIEIKMAQLQAELASARREASRWRDMRAGEVAALVDSARERLASVVERMQDADEAGDEVIKELVADNTLLRHDNLQLAGVLQEVRREAKRLREENDEWRGQVSATTTTTTSKLPATPVDGFPRPLTLTHTQSHTHARHYSLTPSLASVRSNPPPYTHNRQDSWQAAATSPRIRNNSAADSCGAIVEGEEGQHAREVSMSSVSSGPGPWASASASASAPLEQPQPRRKRLSLTPSFRPPVSPLGEGYFPPPAARGMVSVAVQTEEGKDQGTEAAKVDGPTLHGLGLEDTSSRIPSRRGSETSHATPTTPYSAFTTTPTPDATASLLVLADHIGKILQRVRQADVPTLTRRLRRQHLAGDVGHLSASTIKALVRDIDGLRAHARGLLEEERRQQPVAVAVAPASVVARKDFMQLVKLFKELLGELVELRGVVNRVILDPGEVTRMRDAVAAAVDEQGETKRGGGGSGAAGATLGWIAPTIQKLFTGGAAEPTTSASGASAAAANSGTTRGPKLEPSTSASTTHVNVEFASTGIIRRSTLAEEEGPVVRQRQHRERPAMTLGDGSVRQRAGLMGIFAGAQRPAAGAGPSPSAPTIRAKPSMEFGAKRHGHRRQISNAVDAVIDQPVPEDDALPPLLERTLRPRGLSDSSIRSTFQSHAVPVRATRSPDPAGAAPGGSYWDVKTLGRRIQGYATEGTGKGSLAAQNRGYMEVLAGTTPVMSRSFSRGDV